jgi:hypothetical protein
MLAALPIDPGIELVVSSHGMSKGIEQVDGPQFIPRAYVQVGDLQVGGQWKNVTSKSANGEASVFGNLTHKFGSLQLSAGLNYKVQTAAERGTDSHSLELNAGATQKIGKLTLKLSAIYSPNDLGGARRSLYVEGGPSFDLTKTLRLSANIGHRYRENGSDYTSMNVGAAKTLFRAFSLDLRYYRTNRSELGPVYGDRLVLAGRLSF